MIAEAREKLTNHEKQPTLPLIRLRLEVTEAAQMFHPVQFGQDFTGTVANPSDIVIFSKKFGKVKHEEVELDQKLLKETYENQSGIDSNKVEDVIAKYFEEVSGKHKLKVLSVPALQEMTRLMMKTEEKGDDKRNKIVDFYIKASMDFLEMAKKEEIPEKMEEFCTKETETFNNLIKELDKRKSAFTSGIKNVTKESASVRESRAGRGRGRGSILASTSRAKTTSTVPKKAALEVISRTRRERSISKNVTYISSASDDE